MDTMDIIRHVYDPLAPFCFFIVLALFLHLLVWKKRSRTFWERMTQFSCIVAVLGLFGLAGSGRVNFAEGATDELKSAIDSEYKSAKEYADSFAAMYADEVTDLTKVDPDARESAQAGYNYFSHSAELLDRGYKSNAWRDLLNNDTPATEFTETHGAAQQERLGIRSADELKFRPYGGQPKFVQDMMRYISQNEKEIANLEGAKKRQMTEVLFSLLWPYFVGISLAIQLAKASATIRGFV